MGWVGATSMKNLGFGGTTHFEPPNFFKMHLLHANQETSICNKKVFEQIYSFWFYKLICKRMFLLISKLKSTGYPEPEKQKQCSKR